jgi:hypothetical protein
VRHDVRTRWFGDCVVRGCAPARSTFGFVRGAGVRGRIVCRRRRGVLVVFAPVDGARIERAILVRRARVFVRAARDAHAADDGQRDADAKESDTLRRRHPTHFLLRVQRALLGGSNR